MSKKEETALVPFDYAIKDILFKKPEVAQTSSPRCITRIDNAYNKCGFIDKTGVMWFDSERIDDILRTNKSNARYLLKDIEDEFKRFIGNKMYVRGYEVRRLLDIRIQNEGIGKKKDYLLYSERIYNAIRDCDTAEKIRTSYDLEIKESKKTLKRKRITKYKIEFDELTGENLIKRTAEFSHIRSFAMFRDSGDDIENGLIVNKETHMQITKSGINDEDELISLCKENNWRTNWYQNFKSYFREI